jgi:hypothetical protein
LAMTALEGSVTVPVRAPVPDVCPIKTTAAEVSRSVNNATERSDSLGLINPLFFFEAQLRPDSRRHALISPWDRNSVDAQRILS